MKCASCSDDVCKIVYNIKDINAKIDKFIAECSSMDYILAIAELYEIAHELKSIDAIELYTAVKRETQKMEEALVKGSVYYPKDIKAE